MKIVQTSFPSQSILNTPNSNYDYTDSFVGMVNDANNSLTATELGKSFFMSGPKWVGALFALRNKIVSLFGLKTGNVEDREQALKEFNCEPGDSVGLFKVFDKTDDEVILGEDDRHLNFRVSLLKTQNANETTKKNITVSTTVQFNNWFGKLYFLPVRPFHKRIVPTMLKQVIHQLESNEITKHKT